jgi:hypothetical protein
MMRWLAAKHGVDRGIPSSMVQRVSLLEQHWENIEANQSGFGAPFLEISRLELLARSM